MALILLLWKKELFLNPIDTQRAIDDFSISQYVLGDARQKTVSDETVYIAAAVAQNNGTSPTDINFEHPPLGKYLIGLGILIFRNPLWLNLLSYMTVIASIGIILKHWQMSNYLILTGMAMFSLSGSFVPQQFSNIMLDGFYICFYTVFLAILLTKKSSFQKNLLLGVFAGLLFSTKYSIPLGLVLVGLPLLVNFLTKKLSFLEILLIITASTSIYLLSYWAYFGSGKNLVDFAYFEWYRFNWWFGERTMPSWLILSSLFKGYYPAWFSENQNEIVKMTGWTILFPIQFLLATVGGVYLWFKQKNIDLLILVLISTIVFLAAGFGKSSDLKYLIVSMPIWSLIIIKLFQYIAKK